MSLVKIAMRPCPLPPTAVAPPQAVAFRAASSRTAFTLIELLVAVSIFIVGFTAVYGLFLHGTRSRAKSEMATRCSLAASSLIAEFRLLAGTETGAPMAPAEYLGDGNADNGADDATACHPYRDQPGIWYCVRSCTDLTDHPDNVEANALVMDLVVTYQGAQDPSTVMPFTVLARRARIDSDDTAEILDIAIERGILQRYRAVILRHPSWAP
jgi:prepilin-type N-terminal cleavage/methylation domain-containing protein